jgi:hypothetical protein
MSFQRQRSSNGAHVDGTCAVDKPHSQLRRRASSASSASSQYHAAPRAQRQLPGERAKSAASPRQDQPE